MSKSFIFLNSLFLIILLNLESVVLLSNQKSIYVTYLLKFLSPDTIYPVVLKDKSLIDPKKIYDHTVWYQHHKKNLVEISKFKQGFFGNISRFSNETVVGNDLLLLKYEKQENILDHYEPIHFFKEPMEDIEYKDDEYELKNEFLIENTELNNKYKKIYTLAYYDDLEILINDSGMDLSVECILDITMPKFLSKYQRTFLENELKKLISFRIKFEAETEKDELNNQKTERTDFTENSDYLQIYKAKAGPFIFKKHDLHKQHLVCELLLKDYDLTNVLRKRAIKKFSSKQNNSSNKVIINILDNVVFFIMVKIMTTF